MRRERERERERGEEREGGGDRFVSGDSMKQENKKVKCIKIKHLTY